jgi:hypothetical protein
MNLAVLNVVAEEGGIVFDTISILADPDGPRASEPSRQAIPRRRQDRDSCCSPDALKQWCRAIGNGIVATTYGSADAVGATGTEAFNEIFARLPLHRDRAGGVLRVHRGAGIVTRVYALLARPASCSGC